MTLSRKVLEELTKKREAALADPSLITKTYADYLRMLDQHAPALLAAAQRVEELDRMYADLKRTVEQDAEFRFERHRIEARLVELEAECRLDRAELAAIDDALGQLTEATRQAQVRRLVADRERLDWLEDHRSRCVVMSPEASKNRFLAFDVSPGRQFAGPTARAAIDAYRAGRQQEEASEA